jgi:di/tricarboxylate transporter
MTRDQLLILLVLVATVALFLWSRWRHDMVAMASLLACVALGLVAPSAAFLGFAHPAVITVACVLVLSGGLQASGAVDAVTRRVLPAAAGPTASIAALAALAAALSAFMNNVGALALLMPVALQVAVRLDLPPGRVLMPLSFGSILGGMTTLIGTPPNLIVSGFRRAEDGAGFAMFDFAVVGLPVALAGVLFVALLGWRLVPPRRMPGAGGFDAGAYVTEVRVPEGSAAAGKRLREVEAVLDQADAQVLGLVRNDVQVLAPRPGRGLRAGDILIIEAEAKALPAVLAQLGLKLAEDRPQAAARAAADPPVAGEAPRPAADARPAGSDDIALLEVAVLPASEVVGRSATDLLLRTRYGINLLAVSRRGERSIARLRTLPLEPGDVLLLQGPPEILAEFCSASGCVPLAARDLRIPDRRRALLAGAVMAGGIAAAASGLLPTAIALAAAVLAAMVFKVVPPRRAYEAIDWSVIVLLAALIPVAGAMEATGAADVIARVLLDQLAAGDPVWALAIVLVVTMTLSDVMNNAATAAVMCPVALGTAAQLGVSADPFLMAVAIGASCAFLTPIGHQNNTLILGPGGLRFGDYWRLGLPLEALVVAVSLPLLLRAWPM